MLINNYVNWRAGLPDQCNSACKGRQVVAGVSSIIHKGRMAPSAIGLEPTRLLAIDNATPAVMCHPLGTRTSRY